MTTTKTTKALKANGFKRITIKSVVNWEKQRMLGTKNRRFFYNGKFKIFINHN